MDAPGSITSEARARIAGSRALFQGPYRSADEAARPHLAAGPRALLLACRQGQPLAVRRALHAVRDVTAVAAPAVWSPGAQEGPPATGGAATEMDMATLQSSVDLCAEDELGMDLAVAVGPVRSKALLPRLHPIHLAALLGHADVVDLYVVLVLWKPHSELQPALALTTLPVLPCVSLLLCQTH